MEHTAKMKRKRSPAIGIGECEEADRGRMPKKTKDSAMQIVTRAYTHTHGKRIESNTHT